MKTILALLILLTCCGSVFGQEKRDELDANFILLKPSCVDNSASLFSMDGTYEANDLIIIISHLGKTEKKIMADRRLYNARTFLSTMTVKARLAQRIIISKGEDSPGKGYLDFFVKGGLELRIYFSPNKDLYVQPCWEDPDQKICTGANGRLFYPCKKN